MGMTGAVSAYAATLTHINMKRLSQNCKGVTREDTVEILGSTNGFSGVDCTASAVKKYIRAAVDSETTTEFSVNFRNLGHLDKNSPQTDEILARFWTKLEHLEVRSLDEEALKDRVNTFKI